jgi:hypothetical protein
LKRWLLLALILVGILLLWLWWRQKPHEVAQSDSCIERAALKVPGWKSQGKSDLEIDRLYQAEIALCNGVKGSCAAYAGAVNADYAWLARQLLSGSLTPAQYLARVRDRSVKLRRARKSAEICDAYVRGDADGDLVPDDRDHCANTPSLDPTTADGCPDTTPLPPAPTPEQVSKAAEGLKVPLTGACQKTSIPDGSAVLRTGLNPSNSESFLIEISPVTNQPAKCPVFYEVEVRLSNSSFFSGSLNQNLFRRVFRAADSVTTASAQNQNLVFQLRHSDPIPWDQLVEAGIEPSDHAVKFIRVRAVNGNGMSPGWSSTIRREFRLNNRNFQ